MKSLVRFIVLFTLLMGIFITIEAQSTRNDNLCGQRNVQHTQNTDTNEKYHLHNAAKDKQPTNETVIEDNSGLLRLVNLRPQRTANPLTLIGLQQSDQVSLLKKLLLSKSSDVNAYVQPFITPIPRNASADYYVFALQRLIC